MAFNDFLGAISAPSLRAIAEHWNSARGGRPLPAWSDLRPSAIKPYLPIIWSYRYDGANDRFTGRLAGDAIEELFGRTLRNTPMQDLFPAENYPAVLARHRRVVRGPEFYRGTGSIFRHIERFGLGERIILPLADGCGAGDGVIGATLYDKLDMSVRGKLAEAQETEEWFALE